MNPSPSEERIPDPGDEFGVCDDLKLVKLICACDDGLFVF